MLRDRPGVSCAAAGLAVAFAAALGGCGRDETRPPELTFDCRRAGSACFVLTRDDCYYLCRRCTLTMDDRGVLCDERGLHVLAPAVPVPADADQLRVEPDGTVLVYCGDCWRGLGLVQVVCAARRLPKDGSPVRMGMELADCGRSATPGCRGFPAIEAVVWRLDRPAPAAHAPAPGVPVQSARPNAD